MGRKRKPESDRIACTCDRKSESHWRWPSGQCYTEIDLESRRARRHVADAEQQRERVRKNAYKPEYVAQRKAYTQTERGREAQLEAYKRHMLRRTDQIGPNPPKLGWKRRQFEKQGGRCYYCHEALPIGKLDQEHMTPLSRGGLHDVSNLVLACRSDNSRKKDKTAEEYYEYLRRR